MYLSSIHKMTLDELKLRTAFWSKFQTDGNGLKFNTFL